MASGFDEAVQSVLSLIEGANLPHPLDQLLCAFLTEALNPRLAASFVEQNCRPGEDQQVDLLSLATDWKAIVECVSCHGSNPPAPDTTTAASIAKRDGGRCCITGKAGSRKDPLIVAPILPIPSGWIKDDPRILHMLGAFFTPAYRDWWLGYIRAPDQMSAYHSHWLVRKSAADAFARGTIKLIRLPPSMIEYQATPVFIGLEEGPIDLEGSFPLLGDHSRSRTPTVDARFVGTHARLSHSIRWLAVARRIASNKEDHKPPSAVGVLARVRANQQHGFSPWHLLQNACLAAWATVPDRARVAVYELLRRIGSRLYGATNNYSTVQRLPFGLFLKYQGDPGGFRNEFNALQMARRYTSIPVPRPLDVAVVRTSSNDTACSHDAYLLTTQVPGRQVVECHQLFSDQDISSFVRQMQDYVTQLRSIPKTVGPQFAICDTTGGACRDPRIHDANPVGPFVDEEAFNQLLRNPDDPSRRNHTFVLTHADLNFRNILVDEAVQADGTTGWTVTGIVDWETAGYYPEYWEYTKSLFESFRYSYRLRETIHNIFRVFGDYSKEVEVEKRSWEEGDYI
ncbi:Protein kinase-like domain protein [Tolypocladium paradoxum]|uniref:Protein kinase-like domain protein n=1 Tax=Tolypocladium paradoxum TaxID=94208 RepID=A0A2S4L2U1_9HYPO|nr:Protein kinase-like domain protein [Tolypocladium paradoxum]